MFAVWLGRYFSTILYFLMMWLFSWVYYELIIWHIFLFSFCIFERLFRFIWMLLNWCWGVLRKRYWQIIFYCCQIAAQDKFQFVSPYVQGKNQSRALYTQSVWLDLDQIIYSRIANFVSCLLNVDLKDTIIHFGPWHGNII